MNERNNASPPANIGISLLLVVFLVLCLFTFSAIALVQAQNEWRQAQLTRDNRTAYYNCTNEAEKELWELNRNIKNNSEAPKKKIKRRYTLSDTQALAVVFFYDEAKSCYQIRSFRTIFTKEWKGDDSLNVIR